MNPQPPKHHFKILVVEDNLLDFELIETALVTQFDCDVHLVMTQGQFEGELADLKPDLIISDSNMPGFDGFAALQLAGERCPDVPFVFCSGNPNRERADLSDNVGWVAKEKGFAALVNFVKKTLESKKGDM